MPSQIDARVSLGNVLTMLTVVISISANWVTLNSSVARLEQRLVDLETRITRIEVDHDAVTALKIEMQSLRQKAP